MSEQRDYRDTVFLPKTDFPMKAGLPAKEPGILARWEEEGLYRQLREARAGREQFILHDGPPYANGDMHIGHALNHILKDMVVRTQSLLGKDAPYVPGWDCHGLPIEWKVEEEYRKKKRNKDEVPRKEFRAECRAYAQHWVDVQREQLKRLGVCGHWDKPYLTMDFEAEATIVAELLKFAESSQLYRGAKPVMWSPVEKTALAEAEVEYEEITSTQIDVAFEIVAAPNAPQLQEAINAGFRYYAVIWTTTPWTIPVNQGIAFGPSVDYAVYELSDGRRIVIAMDHDLTPATLGRMGEVEKCLGPIRGNFDGTIARHPMHHLGGFYAAPRPFLPGGFVTTDSGTGLVHMAPDHGEDDFDLCRQWAAELGTPELPLAPVFAVEADGLYRDDWPWLGGADERRRAVINPNFNAPDGPICEDLRTAGALLAASADYSHSYPHSWRSKKKVIFRCTPQWFVPMDKAIDRQVPLCAAEADIRAEQGEGRTLRETALAAIAETRFVPAKGRNRIGAMVEGRPDWVLSRQRAWGVPITLFVNRKTGQYLADPQVNARIIAAIREGGVDAWDAENAQALLGPGHDAADYEQITDILDVWFDSGCTHAFVLESGKWPELARPETHQGPPADLYLEGSDQHRGWFQSSLLESCATRGHAPYRAVLTHGFTMDARGEKMSKSKGNTVSPIKVMEQYGADIIRLWALSVDYTEDHRIGDEILKGVADQYRKLRNTFRYLLGALEGFNETERVQNTAEMPELERYMLALLARLDETLRQAVEDFDFNAYTRALADFCNEDLSAFYFDIRKDCLYCDAPADPKRRAYRTVLDTLFHALIRYGAPVLVYTAEEVWSTRYPGSASVHLLEWPELQSIPFGPEITFDKDDEYSAAFHEHAQATEPQRNAEEQLLEKWTLLRKYRSDVMEAIEPLRREKKIGSSLAAEVEIDVHRHEHKPHLEHADLAEMFISGPVKLVNEVATNYIPGRASEARIVVTPTSHHKCGRCWRHLPEVAEDGALCGRCADAVKVMENAA